MQLAVRAGSLEHWGSVGVHNASTGRLNLDGPRLAGFFFLLNIATSYIDGITLKMYIISLVFTKIFSHILHLKSAIINVLMLTVDQLTSSL